MKDKRIIYALAAGALVLLTGAGILLACLSGNGSTPSSGTGLSTPTITNSDGSVIIPEPGQVTLYTCDPQLVPVYGKLASEYTRLTGTVVTIVSGQGGNCYTELQQKLASNKVPTVFCLHDEASMNAMADSLFDLTGSAFADTLCAPEFGFRADGRLLALAADVEGCGLIYNAELLTKAGWTREDITSFADLQTTSQYITGSKPGYSVFSTPDFSDTGHKGLACLLAGQLSDPQQLRSFWDLYLANDKAADSALEQFLSQNSIFYAGGTWDYEKVAPLGDHKLDILPAYCPEGGSLQYITNMCWALNRSASPEDLDRTLDFMVWLVSARKNGSAPVDELGLLAPYADAASYQNPLEKKLRQYMASEAVSAAWACCPGKTEEDLASLSAALLAYAQAPSDETWAAVAEIL